MSRQETSGGPELRPYERVQQPESRAASSTFDGMSAALSLTILDASLDCIKLVERDGSVSYMNRHGRCAMEIDDFCMVEAKPWVSLWPAETATTIQRSLDDALTGTGSQFEAFCPTAKGTPRWWHVSVSPVFGAEGGVDRILAISRDITDRVTYERTIMERDRQLSAYNETLAQQLTEQNEALDRQSSLMGEIDHRVKNSFAVISGLLRMQERGIDDPAARDAIRDAANRISLVGRVHDMLHKTEDFGSVELGTYLGGLVDNLVPSITNRGRVRFACSATFDCTPQTALAVGMVLVELVSNAVRHGKVQSAEDIAITVTEGNDGTECVLSVVDRGEGLPNEFDQAEGSGLGMKICRTYTTQLNGILTVQDVARGGTEATLRFPII